MEVSDQFHGLATLPLDSTPSTHWRQWAIQSGSWGKKKILFDFIIIMGQLRPDISSLLDPNILLSTLFSNTLNQ
jgi:hypothetical protein